MFGGTGSGLLATLCHNIMSSEALWAKMPNILSGDNGGSCSCRTNPTCIGRRSLDMRVKRSKSVIRSFKGLGSSPSEWKVFAYITNVLQPTLDTLNFSSASCKQLLLHDGQFLLNVGQLLPTSANFSSTSASFSTASGSFSFSGNFSTALAFTSPQRRLFSDNNFSATAATSLIF